MSKVWNWLTEFFWLGFAIGVMILSIIAFLNWFFTPEQPLEPEIGTAVVCEVTGHDPLTLDPIIACEGYEDDWSG